MGEGILKLDDTDLLILNLLAKNSRLSFTRMSRETGIPDATLQHRFRRMMKYGVVKRFTIELNHNYASNYFNTIVLVKTSQEKHDEVKSALAALDEVYEVYALFYDYDLMIKVSGRSLDEVSDIIRDKIKTMPGVSQVREIAVVEEVKDVHAKWIAPS